MDADRIREQMNLEIDLLSVNQLTDLGNQAIKLGIIIGHGYRAGQYELLHKDKAIMLPPAEAISYLRAEIDRCINS